MAGGMLSDDRSINMVDEMLGIIPGQTRSYVSSATGSISLGGTPCSPQQLPIHSANSMTGITYGTASAAAQKAMTNPLPTTAGTGMISVTGTTVTITGGTFADPGDVGKVLYANTPGLTYSIVGIISAVGVGGTTATIAQNLYGTIPLAVAFKFGLTFSVSAPSANSKTVTFSDPTSLAAGTILYDNTFTYIGTIAAATTSSTTATLVNLPTKEATASTNGEIAYLLTNANSLTSAFNYNITLPVDTITSNNVSYTFQAGDDFEQEMMTYGKNQGFSVSGGSGGALDMNASYMAQAVQLGMQPYPTTATFLTVPSGAAAGDVTATGIGTNFVAADVGRKIYTKGNGDSINSIVFVGTIKIVTSATSIDITLAKAWTSPGQFEFLIGGFSQTTIPVPIEDLIFARCRLFIDDVAAFPLANPTPVTYQFLAFSYGLQCSWTPKFTGEGQQGINPTWSFALFTNYSVSGDFTVEHDTIASGQYSASSVESLKYAWRNRVPKIIQVDAPGSTMLNWYTPKTLGAGLTQISSGSETISATNGSTTLSASTYIWLSADIGKDVFVYQNGIPQTGTIAVTGTTVTGTGTTFVTPGDVGKNLYADFGNGVYVLVGVVQSFTDATNITLASNVYGNITTAKFVIAASAPTWVWIGKISAVSGSTTATLAAAFTGTTATSGQGEGYFGTVSQPYFPVAGYGPTKTYTGLSFRMPVQIMQVSPISDNDGNDIVTVSWQMRYDSTTGSAGDIRIVNQLATLPVAG